MHSLLGLLLLLLLFVSIFAATARRVLLHNTSKQLKSFLRLVQHTSTVSCAFNSNNNFGRAVPLTYICHIMPCSIVYSSSQTGHADHTMAPHTTKLLQPHLEGCKMHRNAWLTMPLNAACSECSARNNLLTVCLWCSGTCTGIISLGKAV